MKEIDRRKFLRLASVAGTGAFLGAIAAEAPIFDPLEQGAAERLKRIAWEEGYPPGWPREVKPETTGYFSPDALHYMLGKPTNMFLFFPSTFAYVARSVGWNPYPPGTVVVNFGMPFVRTNFKYISTQEEGFPQFVSEHRKSHLQKLESLRRGVNEDWLNFMQKLERDYTGQFLIALSPTQGHRAGDGSFFGEELLLPQCLEPLPVKDLPEGIETKTFIIEGNLDQPVSQNREIMVDWLGQPVGSLGILSLKREEIGPGWQWRLSHVFQEKEKLLSLLRGSGLYLNSVKINSRYFLGSPDNIGLGLVPVERDELPSGLLIQKTGRENQTKILGVWLWNRKTEGSWSEGQTYPEAFFSYKFIPLTTVEPGEEIKPGSRLSPGLDLSGLFDDYQLVVSLRIVGQRLRATLILPEKYRVPKEKSPNVYEKVVAESFGGKITNGSLKELPEVRQPVRDLLLARPDEITLTISDSLRE